MLTEKAQEDTFRSLAAESIAVVIPCYNAGKRIAQVINQVKKYVPTLILVDDGSTDGCTEGLDNLVLQLIRFPENRGKGHALLEGFRYALTLPQIEYIAVIDADGQHDPAELPHLYHAMTNENADLVIGFRQFDLHHVPWRSRIGNKFTAWLVGSLLGEQLPDTQSGYRLHSRKLLDAALKVVAPGRYETEIELLVFALLRGYKVIFVPIKTIYEPQNAPSHFRKIRDSARVLLRLFLSVRKFRTENK